jgi:surfactin synthase thioesterase subunit
MTSPAQFELIDHRSPVNCFRPQWTADVRLVTFAHAGGGPLTFLRWSDALAPDVELWHVTLPGRAGRRHEPFAYRWAPLVTQLTDAIARDVSVPVALFGHSLGALLAFEVARHLTQKGMVPAHLIVSGRAAPHIRLTDELPHTDEALLQQVDRMYGGVPDEVRTSKEVLKYFLPVLRADLELARAYVFRPAPALPCPIMAMTGVADPIARLSDVEEWSRHTDADCELHVLPGGHFFLVDQEPAVLSKILKRLAR